LETPKSRLVWAAARVGSGLGTSSGSRPWLYMHNTKEV
jgi:hypothetical protein